ncbi:hypothetical protein NL676_001712 [Syzygium grande]|nr:hypothetical protein NL676_001712 [Syzygium grande]
MQATNSKALGLISNLHESSRAAAAGIGKEEGRSGVGIPRREMGRARRRKIRSRQLRVGPACQSATSAARKPKTRNKRRRKRKEQSSVRIDSGADGDRTAEALLWCRCGVKIEPLT